jgi:hypothetical protein
VVVRVPTFAEARRLREDVESRVDHAVHGFRVVDARPGTADDPDGERWTRARIRAVAHGVSPGSLARLDDLVAAAAPDEGPALRTLVDLCVADTGFVLVVVDGGRDDAAAPATTAVVDAAAAAFARPLTTAGSVRAAARVRLARPEPARLERQLDRDLLTAILAEGDDAVAAWRNWRSRHSIDDFDGVARVAPMLFENLSRLEVADEWMPRIRGFHRRAWYSTQLVTRDATGAVTALRAIGCAPVVVGETVLAVDAAESGSVRSVRALDLFVPRRDATRAADALAELGWIADGLGLTDLRLARHTGLGFRTVTGRRLHLHWERLPRRCSELLGPTTDDVVRRVGPDAVEVTTESPTAQLLGLWARPGDPDPGHALSTVCATADVVARHADAIDWPRLWADCDRLELRAYAQCYLRANPRAPEIPGAPACA